MTQGVTFAPLTSKLHLSHRGSSSGRFCRQNPEPNTVAQQSLCRWEAQVRPWHSGHISSFGLVPTHGGGLCSWLPFTDASTEAQHLQTVAELGLRPSSDPHRSCSKLPYLSASPTSLALPCVTVSRFGLLRLSVTTDSPRSAEN